MALDGVGESSDDLMIDWGGPGALYQIIIDLGFNNMSGLVTG